MVRFEEANAIVVAAREHRQEVRSKPDCSRLVHQIYQSAGFEYPFATSNELYAGAERFVRVKEAEAQRGDLIVWPGHVGIVVEPALRAFYSSLRSGLRLDFYDTQYWRKRGHARFYRYAKRATPRPEAAPAKTFTAESSQRRVMAPAHAFGASEPIGAETPSASLVSSKPSVPVTAGDEIPLEWPDRAIFRAARRTPAEDEITAAIAELQALAASSFDGRDLLRLDRPVVVVDQMLLEGFAITGDRGWAMLRADIRMTVTGERVDLARSRERRRWELRRVSDGWVLVAPKNRAYVSRDAAVSILGAQLATLARNPEPAAGLREIEKRKVTTLRMLNAMVDGQ